MSQAEFRIKPSQFYLNFHIGREIFVGEEYIGRNAGAEINLFSPQDTFVIVHHIFIRGILIWLSDRVVTSNKLKPEIVVFPLGTEVPFRFKKVVGNGKGVG